MHVYFPWEKIFAWNSNIFNDGFVKCVNNACLEGTEILIKITPEGCDVKKSYYRYSLDKHTVFLVSYKKT